jgi:hypothetical protein
MPERAAQSQASVTQQLARLHVLAIQTGSPVEDDPSPAANEDEALRALNQAGLLSAEDEEKVKTGGGPSDARLALDTATQRRGNR